MTASSWPEVVLAGQRLGGLRHVCALVRSSASIHDLQVALVEEGLSVGDRVVSLTAGSARAAITSALDAAGLDVEARSRDLVALTWDETYLTSGAFDPASMLGLIRRWLEDGRRQKGPGLTRIVADMSWTLSGPPGVARLGEYEARLDDYLRRMPNVVVCIYDLDRHDAGTIAEVLAHHPVTLSDGALRAASGLRPPSSPRSRILTAASDLFSEDGVTSTGVDAIIEAAGVAKATFYRQFRSKDNLIVAWLEDPRSRWFDRVRREAEISATRPEDVIPRIYEATADWLDGDGYRGCPYLNSAVELVDPMHPARPVIRRYLEEIDAYLTGLAAAAGVADPGGFAAGLHALLAGGISLGVALRTSAFARAGSVAATRLLAAAAPP